MVLDNPAFIFLVCLVLCAGAAYAGLHVRRRLPISREQHDELGLVLNGSLTLLGLIIGFSFSMAVGRYDTRKADEATEANAIGTEYYRAGFLDSTDAASIRASLKQYLDQRIAWYTTKSGPSAEQAIAIEDRVESQMWTLVERAAKAQQTPIRALVASGMNTVIDNAGYTQAAWRNRIPIEAWALMLAIAVTASALLGANAADVPGRWRALYVIPLLVSIAFFLIADLDSARDGLIRVHPENLLMVQQQLKGP